MNAALTLDSFLAEAMNFTPDSRLELAERLVASVPDDAEIEAAQIEEVSRRMEDVRSGKMKLIPGEDALRQVREAVLGRA
jgi:putative addiction module component (TIGR02574 family)